MAYKSYSASSFITLNSATTATLNRKNIATYPSNINLLTCIVWLPFESLSKMTSPCSPMKVFLITAVHKGFSGKAKFSMHWIIMALQETAENVIFQKAIQGDLSSSMKKISNCRRC